MDTEKFTKLLGAFFGILGSYVIMHSILDLPPEHLFPRTESHWDYNPDMIPVLAGEKADRVAGFAFLFIAFVLQAVAIFIAILFPKGLRPGGPWYAMTVFLLGILVVNVLWKRDAIYQSTKLEMERIAKAKFKELPTK